MLLTRMGKFMYMQAWLTNSIMICMLALHVTTLNHCHIVAMGMTLFQLPKSLILEVLSIKHWRQSGFAETPLTVRHSRDARRRRASMLVYIYTSPHQRKCPRIMVQYVFYTTHKCQVRPIGSLAMTSVWVCPIYSSRGSRGSGKEVERWFSRCKLGRL